MGQFIKTCAVFLISSLASAFPVMAAVKKEMEAVAKYYDDITEEVTFEELKNERDAETFRIRGEIYSLRPALRSDRSEMAKKVMDRKVRIFREKRFLSSEFEKGLNDLYASGVGRFNKKDYEASRLDFEEVEKLSPGFKDTKTYLKKIAQIPEVKDYVQLKRR